MVYAFLRIFVMISENMECLQYYLHEDNTNLIIKKCNAFFFFDKYINRMPMVATQSPR